MDLWTAPVLDVRALLRRERADLLRFIGSLTDEEWFVETQVPGWTVKDLALHILDDDLGWLSRGRDGDSSGRLDVGDSGFVAALNRKNEDWVAAARQLSRPVVAGLLGWAGEQMDAYYATQSLTSQGRVAWANDEPVPNWFDIAQDLTERWVHQMQMREALDRVETYADDYLSVVMQTFVWAFPHQYRAQAASGARILLDLGTDDRWTLTSDGTRWELGPCIDTDMHDAKVHAQAAHGWRWLTGGTVPAGTLLTSGPAHLVEPLARIRAALI
ncbi:maleylpyruvate isomerase N-terminal domain-containing protein [Nocardioides rubriscoriae]|uniref:maleylpyruvate isomerase N-terminal domain-containing protein n=1 Tax=Nocardioides rubriscoriae TaxID=642762 RepID=UPI0011DF5FD4|nr:maleylpyruvate isomerase N-terminal domain-containing protein [Nocardioides rubriscoriae]